MYRINGVACTKLNECLPTNHRIGATQETIKETVGGVITIEPPSGDRRTHVWEYDGRSTVVMGLLLEMLGTSRIAVIDTYDIKRDAQGRDILLENLVVVWQRPEIKTQNSRGDVEGFSLTFIEAYPQTGGE